MPTVLNQAGFTRTARPNIYARVDASALSGGAPTSGRVAVVGDFPSFPSAEPVSFFSRRALVSYDPTDRALSHLAQLAFNPANDPNINGGASAVLMCSARAGAVAGALDLGPLTLTSKIYGPRSNRLTAALEISANTYTLNLNRAGLTESYEVESAALFTLTNDTGESLTLEVSEGALSLSATSGELLALTEAEAPTLRAAVSFIDQLPNISAELTEPAVISLSELDYISETIADGTSASIQAPARAIKAALSSSALVSVELDNSTTALTLSTTTQTATGGAQGSSLDYSAALASLEALDVQIIALMDTSAGAAAQLATHLDAAAAAGYERQAFTAIDHTATLSEIRERAASINRPDVALAAQQLELFDATGARVTLDSTHAALMFAGMQAGSDTGEPLTRKRPAIIATAQSFNTHTDAEQALRSGLIFISRDTIGPRVERSLTTWLEDDNPIYSEISAYESALVSLRDLRRALADQIGRPTRASQMSLIEARVNARLEAQVRDGIIKRYEAPTLEDLGDHVAVSVSVAPVEPLNFITLTSIITR